MSELLDTKQATELLGVSYRTLLGYVSKKDLTPQKTKGKSYFCKEALETFKHVKKTRQTQRRGFNSPTSKWFSHDEMQVIGDFRLHKKDTGSVDVEIGLLSMRIEKMIDELKRCQDDKMMWKLIRLKLIQAIGQRRKCLSFLQQTDTARYQYIMEKLRAL